VKKILNYCPSCGTQIEGEWNACPYCGHDLNSEKETQIPDPEPALSPPINPQTHQSPQPVVFHRKKNNNFGIAALIVGLLGFFLIPFMGSIIAIIVGATGLKHDDEPSMAKAGLIIGIVGILCWAAFGFMFFSWIFWLVSASV
jgi:hypothetical protein